MTETIHRSLYFVKEQYGALWLQILYHNSTGFVYFNDSNVEYSIHHPQLYSILKFIPRIQKFDDSKFEFLFEYPEYEGYNRWSQKINPYKIRSVTTQDIGFEDIDLTWSGYLFSGLALSNSPWATLMDCCVNSSWAHYSIGRLISYEEKDVIPGPKILDENQHQIDGFNVREERLWIRIKDFDHLFKSFCTLNKCLITGLQFKLLFIMVIFPDDKKHE